MKFWCATAFMDTRELIAVSQMLDTCGYHGLMVSDHLVFPQQLSSKYPYSPHADGRPMWAPDTGWPDPWVLIGAMAAVTTQLHFTTNVYVAPMRPVLQVAKEVSTASVISAGRVALGAGAGWMREEFDLQGQSFTNRGRRFTEMVQVLRELWKPGWVEFHGEFYDIPTCTMEPTPAAPIPIYIGGHTDAALRRAARVGDGWIGNAYPLEEAAAYVAKLKVYLHEYGRDDDPFEIVCGLYAMPSADLYRRAEEEMGLTGTLCMPWAMDQNVSRGNMKGLTRSAEVFRPSIEQFATDIVSQC